MCYKHTLPPQSLHRDKASRGPMVADAALANTTMIHLLSSSDSAYHANQKAEQLGPSSNTTVSAPAHTAASQPVP